MTLSTSLQTTIDDVITRFGEAATFAVDSGTYDPTTSTRTADVTSYTAYVSPPGGARRALEPDSQVERWSERRYMANASLGFTPSPGQKVTIGGNVWRCEAVEPIGVGGSVVAWGLDLVR